MQRFDKHYWEDHWEPTDEGGDHSGLPVNPYLPTETADLAVGTVLDAGCGKGTEALWLADHGWQVTGADISANVLQVARDRAAGAGLQDRIEWIETDVARWEPGRSWDLVITNYAHPDTGQLAFYQRIASWVSPGGTLLIVGHLQHAEHEHGHDHPEGATATLAGITELFSALDWRIVTSYETTRTIHSAGQETQLRDVIVRAQRVA